LVEWHKVEIGNLKLDTGVSSYFRPCKGKILSRRKAKIAGINAPYLTA